MEKAILRIEHLTKTYPGGKRAVDDLSLQVCAGDIYGFIGQNGAGKTTTLRATVGVLPFDGGEIFIDGMSVREQPVQCKAVTAYIPDNPDLYDYLTACSTSTTSATSSASKRKCGANASKNMRTCFASAATSVR